MKSKTSKIAAGLIALVLVVAVAIPMLSSETKAGFNKSSYAVTAGITDYDAMDIETILKRNESLTWVFAGDSITHNGGWTQGMNGYAEWFEQYLYDINRNNDSVINTAWGGADILDFQTVENTSGTNGTAEDPGMGIYNFITKYSPDVVFIKLGMNDRDQTTANFKTRYENMLTSLYDISYNSNKKIPKVVVIAPTPVSVENVYDDLHDPEQNLGSSTAGDEHYDSTLRVRNTLEAIVASCNDGGYKVLFSDFRTGFLQKAVEIGDDYHHTFFTDPSDGVIHPNAAGQYLMFNLLSDTLGIRDEEMPIYQIAYEEFENAALYSGDLSAVENIDEVEMDKNMPTLDGVETLSSVEFTSTSGDFVYNTSDVNASTIDLTEEATGVEPLTVTDLATVGKEYSVVFRAKLNSAAGRANQPIIYLSNSQGTAFGTNTHNRLMLGIPGESNLYYLVKQSSTTVSNLNGSTTNYGNLRTDMNDSQWHTVAFVQSESGLTAYVDGKAYNVLTSGGSAITLSSSIANMFSGITDDTLDAAVGRYDTTATNWKTQGKFDWWQFYGQALTAEQVATLSSAEGEVADWSGTLVENSVWVVAGAKQMSGYEGTVVNRSILRLFDNALRNPTALRDIRVVNAAAPGNTPAYLDANFDAVIGEHITAATTAGNNTVFMLLPEIPEVYDENYDASTIDAQVSAYKGYVESLIGKSTANIEILWTPLASSDATINGYLSKYAKAVREVAAANKGVLLFDAYAYMNAYMVVDEISARNWFDNNGYISPLGATDITLAFINSTNLSGITTTELTGHNLRYDSDVRVFKGNYIRDYYETVADVSGETVILDVSAIVNAGYTLDTSSLALLPEAGTGNYNENIIWLKDVASDLTYANNKFTFTAPCSDLDIAIYSKKDRMIYRFKDVDLTVDTDNVIDTTPNPTSAVLDSLEIVGVPAVDLAKGDVFDVTLYQYQKYPQVRATAQDGLKITVTYTDKDGKEVSEVVKSGKNSGLIPEEVTTVNVTVSGTVGGSVAERTYTLNLTRPDYPDIIITEVMQDGYSGYDMSGYDNYELVEIYNASGKDLNLLNYSIGYKKDYPTDLITETKGEWPYYFTGNNQAFNGGALYTGVNQITKYSSYWISDGTVTEPTEVIFPADSTMVIWVKEASADLTFDTLRSALQENAFAKNQKTLTVDVDGTETAVVPTEKQLVVAEIPEGAKKGGQSNRANVTADNSIKNFYLDNFGSVADKQTTRGWLFILGDEAHVAANGAISEAGNDIISASKFVRIAQAENKDAGKIGIDPDRLSSVFSYNVERGMSLIKDEAKWDTDVNTFNVGHTSDEQGYSNLTSFGAIEYWQKPADLDDEKAPIVDESGVIFNVDSDTAAVRLAFSDDNDVRYIELNVKDEDGKVTTVTKDIVLASGVENGGLSPDNKKYEYTYAVADTDESSKITFWGYVEDGNGNVTEFGSEDEEVDVCTKAVQGFLGDKVADYLANGTYPTMDGKLFAGWYTVENIPTDLEEARAVSLGNAEVDVNATYYALFVPKHVLSVKAQISGTLYDDNMTNDDSASIRFVTTVDTLQYKKVGFKVSYLGTNATIGSHEVYKQLYAVGSSTDVMTEYTPQGEFCQMSNYFKTGTITGVPASYYNTEFKVTPYWITWDGTTVEGVTVVKTIEEGMPKDVVYVSASGVDQAGYGTYEYPYATLNYAIENVGHSGIVYIIGDYTISADFAWNVHNKRVTIAGDVVETTGTKEKLDFSALSDLRINDAVTFSDITLTLPATVYAEGNELVVADSVELTNTPTVYGGSKKFEVAKTDVKLYAGTYATIYGGGNKTNVTGDTHVTIGGNVNGSIDYANHSGTNNLYGGSNNGTVAGDTNIKVETTTARFNYVYGAGYGASSVVEGATNVNFAGTAMSVYGGSHTGINSDTHVTMTGGYVEQIFGGANGNSMTGNTDVRVLGGEVARRIYGGCYNDANESVESYLTLSFTMTWKSTHHVNGYTSVTIADTANLSFDYTKTYGGILTTKTDNTLSAFTRHESVLEGENAVLIFNDNLYSANSSKIKFDCGSLNCTSGAVTQFYDYLVKATTGGQVYSMGDKLQIIPDSEYVATVEVNGSVVHYTEGESLYTLPAFEGETEEVIVTFGTTKQSTTNYEARIDNVAYYPTVEEAFGVATSDTTIELLKNNVDVASTLTVSDTEKVTVKNAEGVNATVSRGDALVNGSVFDVEAGGTLTIEDIILDGRTAAEISAETTDLASLTGSTASLINTAGEVHLKNVVAQYAVKTDGYGAVVYGEGVAATSLTVDNSEFNYNKSANQGGAICLYAHSGSLEVRNSTFDHNEASANGGALSTHAGTALIENCIFTNNTATGNGGALYSGTSCVVTMKNTTEDATKALASGNQAANGGAISIGSGSNTITGYTFKTNTATANGGAVHNNSATITAISCYFEGNSAPAGGAILNQSGGKVYLTTEENSEVESMFKTNTTTGNGGAICMNSGSITVEGYTFDGNTATGNGGAIRFNNSEIEASFTDSSFVNNRAGARGGAIDNNSSNANALFTFVSTDNIAKFENNSVTGNGAGGAIYNAAKMNIVGYTFKDNNAVGVGGAISNAGSAGNTTIVNTKFEGNETQAYGGAIANSGSAKLAINATSEEFGVTKATLATFEGNISNNTATGMGGGAVYFGSGTFSVNGYAFNNNTSEGDAGALCLRAASTVTNCTFTENSADKTGGALYCYNNATITGSTFTNNTAVGTTETVTNDDATTTTTITGGGGAIQNVAGNTVIKTSTFSGNTTEQQGGAIFNTNKVTISDSSFTSNIATKNAGALMNAAESTAIITDTSFATNESPNQGGAIFNNGATLTLTGTKDTALFDGNKATGSGVYGGAIYNDGTMNVTKYIFTNNYAPGRGGAISNYGKDPIITDCKFVGNYADGNGGAVYSGGSVTINLVASGTSELAIFDGNYATGGTGGGAISVGSGKLNVTGYKFINNYAKIGGAIYNSGGVTTTLTGLDSNIVESLFKDNYSTSGGGGAIYVPSGTLNVNDYTFDSNESKTAGGAIYRETATVTINDSKFVNNIATAEGGAIYGKSAGGDVKLIGTDSKKAIIQNNQATNSGGAIYINGSGTLTVSGYTFDTNETLTGSGGAIYRSVTALDIVNTKFSGNIAKGDGGAIYGAGGGAVQLTGTDETKAIFEANSATGTNGGGAIRIGTGTLSIDGYKFTGNHAVNGGAIQYNNQSSAVISNSEFSENYATINGGAIYTRASHMQVSETSFTDNYTVDGSGGAIYLARNKLTLTSESGNAVFSGNKAQGTDKVGGAICAIPESGATCTLNGSGYTFENNTATNGGAIWLAEGVTSTLTGAEFNENSSTTYGGAIYADTTTLTMSDTSFTGNESTYGGAIHSYASTLTATSCEFTSNVSANAGTPADGLGKGGGALNIVGNSDVTLNTADSIAGTFASNSTNSWGGAIYVTDSKLSVDGYNFTSNTAKHAAAILFDDDVELISEAVADDESTTNVDESADAVYDELNTDTYTVANSNFTKNSAANSGGAFYNNKGTITFTDCKFVENSSAAQGGVMYISGGNVSFEGTDASKAIFESNSATNGAGGALRTASATVSVTGYTFTKNTSSGQGGAIYHNGSGYVLTVEDCKFGGTNAEGESLGNTATDGGAIYNAGSAKTIVKASDSPIVTPIFEKNMSTSTNIGGGAICVGSGNLEVYDYQFKQNSTAKFGGAIEHNGSGTLKVERSTFNTNTAASHGGAIYTVVKSDIKDSTFNQNYCVGNGGAIANYNASNLTTVERSVFDTNYTTGASTNGGAMYAQYATITDSKFVNNYTTNIGGAIYKANSAAALTINTTGSYDSYAIFDGNHAKEGGAIYAYNNASASLSVSRYTLSNNYSSGIGGAICTHVTTNVTDCKFDNNKSTGNRGGAFYGGSTKVFTINVSENPTVTPTMTNNQAKQGGAICIGSGELKVTGYIFDNNNASDTWGGGGAIKLNDAAIPMTLKDCGFTRNKAIIGGAVSITCGATKPAAISIEDCSFGGTVTTTNEGGEEVIVSGANTATGDSSGQAGGAIYISAGATVTLSSTDSAKTFFANNVATTGNGGAIYLVGTLNGSGYTFTDNTPNNIYVNGGTNNGTFTETE